MNRRPFKAEVLRAAREVAGRYGVVVRYDADAESFAAAVIALPLVVGFGDTPTEATREALALAETDVAYTIERGLEPVPPRSEMARTEQINFRVSVEEKARLEAAAQRQGLTLVDYIRSVSLAERGGSEQPARPQAGARSRSNATGSSRDVRI